VNAVSAMDCLDASTQHAITHMAQAPAPRKGGFFSKSKTTADALTQNLAISVKKWKSKSSRGKPHASGLCARCRQIDFPAIFKEELFNLSLDGRFVLSLDKVVHDVTCPACCLFYAIRPQHEHEGTGCHLRVLPAARIFGAASTTMHMDSMVALAVLPGEDVFGFKLYMLRECLARGLALANTRASVSSRKNPESAVGLAAVNAAKVEYSRLKSWLEHCDSSHGQLCGRKDRLRSLSVSLTCIDCSSGKIKHVDRASEYIALSYVWGAPTSGNTWTLGSHVLPDADQVICDAMEVVFSLGKRYLWIDRYCVDQHNHDIKDIQIREMDQIYAGAYATIVAAAGSDATYGLSGVSRPRLSQQSLCEVGELQMGSTLASFSHAIQDTVWRRRAWTYQEGALSRRCIFFTEHQVYFACLGMSRCESVIVHQPIPRDEGVEQFGFDTMSASMFQGETPDAEGPVLRRFTNHITEYSGRSLTYETDGLNAFRGILSRSPIHSFYGIPIDPDNQYGCTDYNVGFAKGLWWTPRDRHLRRRSLFPTWTWVGWTGAVEYCSEHGIRFHYRTPHLMEVQRGGLRAQFILEDSDGRLATIEDVIGSLNGTKLIPELQYSLLMDAVVFQFRLQKKPSWNGSDVCVCKCHPNSTHEGTITYGPLIWGTVNFFEEQPADRIFTEFWDCVVLFESTLDYYSLMVVTYIGDVAYRVGNLQSNKGVDWPDIPRQKRRIRMM
jgi:hypothetical protein